MQAVFDLDHHHFKIVETTRPFSQLSENRFVSSKGVCFKRRPTVVGYSEQEYTNCRSDELVESFSSHVEGRKLWRLVHDLKNLYGIYARNKVLLASEVQDSVLQMHDRVWPGRFL